MSRAAALAALASTLASTLVAVAPATAGVPIMPSGSVVGEGVPLKAYATVTPTVHLFGDVVTARLSIVADTKWVDPARVRVTTDFSPYKPTKAPVLLRVHAGRFEQLTWVWTIRCIASPCVPRLPPSEKYHVFHFNAARLEYLAVGGKRAYQLRVSWPPVEVLSQISPGVAAFLQRTNHLNWRFQIAPVAAPPYRFSPTLLLWLAAALGAASLLAAAWFVRTWVLVVRPPRARTIEIEQASTLERALTLLRWAHEQGDETLQRKAFERVAGELGVEAADELLLTARELAWSPRTPGDVEVEEFAEQALGRQEGDG